ncbi:DUF6438 domain-containing protein [Vitreimonas flagellata]|uniref:DUF6438 domain-containing protein n=1 Tax=Vitreimonas flagellata TaxID=2560861 RepID=UPI001074A96E|nr:DUF6438 domain-containing protein [Vitreimonas flagellata]
MLRRAFVGVFAALALSACASTAPAPNPESAGPFEISMTRTPCFGFCPDYTVTISGDGGVLYEGRRFVNVVGEQRAQISPAEVQALLARFDAIGFDNLENEYRAGVTDLPSTTIQLIRNGRSKSVLDYGGTGAGMPESVRELQAEIDRVAGTARWVLRDGQPVRNQAR